MNAKQNKTKQDTGMYGWDGLGETRSQATLRLNDVMMALPAGFVSGFYRGYAHGERGEQ